MLALVAGAQGGFPFPSEPRTGFQKEGDREGVSCQASAQLEVATTLYPLALPQPARKPWPGPLRAPSASQDPGL